MIMTAKKNAKKTLVLRSLLLTRIPTVIETQTQLKTLVLSDMDIHSLPPEIQNLVQLSNLIVTKCPIYELPDWIGELIQLIKINISRCRLSRIPLTLTKCNKLTSIEFKFNLIKEISTDFLQFPNLSILDVEANPISIDWNGNNIPKLVALNISQTNVHEVPENISKNLIILSWAGVKDIKIPEFTENLRYLNLAASKSDKVPIQVFDLPNIGYINIGSDPSITPEQIESLRQRNVFICIGK